MDRIRYDWPSGTWDVLCTAYGVNHEDVIAALRRTSDRLRLNVQPNKKCQISADMEDIFDE